MENFDPFAISFLNSNRTIQRLQVFQLFASCTNINTFFLLIFFEKVIITFRLIMMQPFPVSLQYKSLSIVYINQIIAKLHILLSK